MTALADLRPLAFPPARPAVFGRLAHVIAPKHALTVSEWADKERRLSTKGSAAAGQWRTDRNPPTREPMDCMSAHHPAREVVLVWPIQFAKTEVAVNVVGYTMDHAPGPIMVCLPGEVPLTKWVAQKLHPMIEETPAVQRSLTSMASREASNTRTFKDFAGGQLYMEHAGTATRLKMTTVRTVIADELDEFAANLRSGDDPVAMLEGRTSAFPSSHKRLYISSPQVRATSRIWSLWERSDQRRYHVPCPHCGEAAPMMWDALHWERERPVGRKREAWLVCGHCGAEIREHHKTDMIAAGGWVPARPEQPRRGYHINCLYYQFGLGPRWSDLVEMWLEAQGDNARLKTFINDRLAEPWEDKSTASVKANIVAERAEPYPLRVAPEGALCVTAGVDTQDDRFEVQVIGWGRGLAFWTLDYAVIPGDPDSDETQVALTEYLSRPIQHANGVATMPIEAVSVDIFGHRTEAVKHWVRQRTVRRPMASFGAKPNNAPVLGKGKLHDVTYRGRYDRRGVHLYQIGTVAAKHVLFGRLAADADSHQKWLAEPERDRAPAPQRMCHFSDDLGLDYFEGLISEAFNPSKNRFEKRRGSIRNEPLDTWVHAYAAAHHPELRLHRASPADWDARAAALARAVAAPAVVATTSAPPKLTRPPPAPAKPGGIASPEWSSRL